MSAWSIQVQAQFTVEEETLEDACNLAVDQAMEMEPTDYGKRVAAVLGVAR